MQCQEHPVLSLRPCPSVWAHLGHAEVSCGSGGIPLLLGAEGGQLVLALAALQLGQGPGRSWAAGTWEGEQHANHFYLILTTKTVLRPTL